MKKEPRKIDLDMARQPGVRMKWCEAHKHFHPHYFKCKEKSNETIIRSHAYSR